MAVKTETREVFTTSDGSTFFDFNEAVNHERKHEMNSIIDALDVYWRDVGPSCIVDELMKRQYTIVRQFEIDDLKYSLQEARGEAASRALTCAALWDCLDDAGVSRAEARGITNGDW